METASAAESWKGERAEVRLTFPSPRLFLHRVTGHYDVEAVRYVFDRLAEHMDRHGQSVIVFGDLDVDSYDGAIRREANKFVRLRGRRIARLSLLARTPLALAALSVQKLMASFEMDVYSSRAHYQRALWEALRREAPGDEARRSAAVAP
jgi:hypothetical protein